jgi:hypothetical protein
VVSPLCQEGGDRGCGLVRSCLSGRKRPDRRRPRWWVIKQRISRPGQGRSRGYRTIVFFRRGSKAFFVYGFAKNQRANIEDDERVQFKEAAKHVLLLTEKQLAELLKRGDFVELKSE